MERIGLFSNQKLWVVVAGKSLSLGCNTMWLFAQAPGPVSGSRLMKISPTPKKARDAQAMGALKTNHYFTSL